MTSLTPKPGPALTQMWLYCSTCNMSHLMAWRRTEDVHAVYRCPGCHAERYVLR